MMQCPDCDVCYADEDNQYYIHMTNSCVECCHGDELNPEERERNAMNTTTAFDKYQQQLTYKEAYYFEQGCEANQMGDDHYAKRCNQALNVIERMMNTNINGATFDVNDGGDYCDICETHHMYCKAHPKSLEDKPMNTTDNVSLSDEEANEWYNKLVADDIGMENINVSELVGRMSTVLHHHDVSPAMSVRAAASFVAAWMDKDYWDMEGFCESYNIHYANSKVESGDFGPRSEGSPIKHDLEGVGSDVYPAFLSCGLFMNGPEGVMIGDKMHELLTESTEAYSPAPAEIGVSRRFQFGFNPKDGVAPAKLTVDAIKIQEQSEFTVDKEALALAKAVVAAREELCAGSDWAQFIDVEGFVLSGCESMSENEAYVSEFKADKRGRTYQAACHGPNGQASDRSRSLMDLQGVSTDYDSAAALVLIENEQQDMIKGDISVVRARLMELGRVQFVIDQEDAKKNDDGTMICSKPYSFIKAEITRVKLVRGDKPYIGMAFGLDAKCSGPQLAALAVGDENVAAACGFTTSKVADAYERAIKEMLKPGVLHNFKGLTRADVKKSVMAVFYGQAAAAFTTPGKDNPLTANAWKILFGAAAVGDDAVAKEYHAAIEASFGPGINKLRADMKGLKGKMEGQPSYRHLDGQVVNMKYKVKNDIYGSAITNKGDVDDVRVIIRDRLTAVMVNASFATDIDDPDTAIRNGFVNMVQGLDAVLSKLIISHLHALGAQHVVAVHDCFRVNVHDMAKLVRAIKMSYVDMFGSKTANAAAGQFLPKDGDMLGNYFKGMEESLVEGEVILSRSSQFATAGKRKLDKIHGVDFTELVFSLNAEEGGVTYFDK
tara:strand:+ start:1515 stop:4016 length:2502 start_codon:yes stop_codon:yes gene_type:complete